MNRNFFFIGDFLRVITSINKSEQRSFWVKSKNKKAEKLRVPVSPEWVEIGSRYPDAVECRISSEILNDYTPECTFNYIVYYNALTKMICKTNFYVYFNIYWRTHVHIQHDLSNHKHTCHSIMRVYFMYECRLLSGKSQF